MSEPVVWIYKTTVKSSHPSSPAIVVSAGAPLPPSSNTLLASSSLRVQLEVYANESEVSQEGLYESALARDVRDWFNKHKGSLGLDGAQLDRENTDGVTIRLNAFSRSARSAAVALPSRTVPPNQPTGLDHLTLSLLFRSPRSASSASQSQGSGSQQLSQDIARLDLMAQILHPDSLHFSLAPLVSSALERVAKKLSAAFPLCFNPRWADRLTNDLSFHRSIASSLSNILNLSDSNSNVLEKDLETPATLLSLTLTTHLSLRHPSPSDLNPSPTASASNLSPDPKAALKTALLLVAKEGSTPDSWQPSTTTAEEDLTQSDQAGRKSGKGQKRMLPVRKEKGEEKKRRLSLAQDDQADFSALADFNNFNPSLSHDARFSPILGDDDGEVSEGDVGALVDEKQSAEVGFEEEEGFEREEEERSLFDGGGWDRDDGLMEGLEDMLWA